MMLSPASRALLSSSATVCAAAFSKPISAPPKPSTLTRMSVLPSCRFSMKPPPRTTPCFSENDKTCRAIVFPKWRRHPPGSVLALRCFLFPTDLDNISHHFYLSSMLRTVEMKLYLTPAQEITLTSWLRTCCGLYNRALEQRIKAYRRRNESQ